MQENAHKPRLTLIRQSFPERPAFGTAVSEALLIRVARGELTDTFRLHRPARELAFAKQDRVAAGFERAVGVARELGFEPVVRLAGGRAALFHEGTLAFAWASSVRRPVEGTGERFALMAGVIAGALERLGVDARIGEVPGEYCPGAWSVNAAGERKLAGIGQRMITGGAHVGGVLVVTDGALVRDTLVAVYEALGLEWRPETTGALADEVPGIDLDRAEEAIVAELAERFELTEGAIEAETLELAATLEAGHLAGRPPGPGAGAGGEVAAVADDRSRMRS